MISDSVDQATTHRPRTSRLPLLLCILAGLAIIASGAGQRMISQVAYAFERGRIQATSDQLARIEEVSDAFRMVSRVAAPGVVHIRVSGGEVNPEQRADMEGLRERIQEQIGRRFTDKQWLEFLEEYGGDPPGSGSGIILDTEGHILTNNHVVAGRTHIRVRLSDEREFDARLIGADSKSDIAVLKIDATGLHPLKFGDSDRMEVGDWVLAVGAPFGLSHTVTHGIVSAKGRRNIAGVNIYYQDFLQTDAAINPGNSGGPLLNLRGEVIGMNTAIATAGEMHNAGVAFTIPSNMLVKIARELKAHGEIARGWLGVQMAPLPLEDAEVMRVPEHAGAIVLGVFEDSPAAHAGLRVEDVIVGVNDLPVRGPDDLSDAIADMRPAEEAVLKVIREGASQEFRVKLGRQPDNMLTVRRQPAVRAWELRDLGVLALTLRPSEARQYGFDSDDRGALIVGRVGESGSIPIGSLVTEANGAPIRSVADLTRALAEGSGRVQMRLLTPEGERPVVYVDRNG